MPGYDEERIKLTDFSPENSYNGGPVHLTKGDKEDEILNELVEIGSGVFVTPKEAEWYRKAIIYVSIATIIPLSMLSVAFLVISIYAGSAAALSLAFDMMLDASSSAVVIWRYFGDSVSSPEKERRTVILFAFLFIIFGLIILTKGILALVVHVTVTGLLILTFLSAIGAVVATILVTIKFIIARKMNSQTMYCDGFSSLMGAITGYSVIISTLSYKLAGLWCLDAIVAILVSVIMAGWGVWLLLSNVHICKSKKDLKKEKERDREKETISP